MCGNDKRKVTSKTIIQEDILKGRKAILLN